MKEEAEPQSLAMHVKRRGWQGQHCHAWRKQWSGSRLEAGSRLQVEPAGPLLAVQVLNDMGVRLAPHCLAAVSAREVERSDPALLATALHVPNLPRPRLLHAVQSMHSVSCLRTEC